MSTTKQCSICKKKYKSSELKLYQVKNKNTGRIKGKYVCDACHEFYLKLYFDKYSNSYEIE